jgi:autotransporter-associated beta strand protein
MSNRISRISLLGLVALALVPSVRANNIYHSGSDSFFESGFELFYAGPQWLLNALPGSVPDRAAHARAARISYDRDGDRNESLDRYGNDVGALASPFNVALFNNVGSFAPGGATSKTSTPFAPSVVTPNTGDTLVWNSTTAGSWVTGSNQWFDLTQNDVASIDTAAKQAKGYNFAFNGTGTNSTVAPTSMTVSADLFALSLSFANNFNATNTTVLGNGGSTARTFTFGRNGSAGAAVAWAITDSATTGSVTYNSNNGGTGGTTMALYTSGTITVATGGTLNLNLPITDADALHTGGIAKDGGGTLSLSGANSYSGGTTVTLGTLQLSGSGTLGSTTGSLAVNGGKLDLNGTSQTVGAFSGTGSSAQINNSSATASTLTVGNAGGSGTFAGSLTNTGLNTINLIKTGAGTLTLTNLNSYLGATTVSGGILELKNTLSVALSGTSGVKINNSGTLLFSGNNQLNQAVAPPITLGTVGGSGAAPKIDAGGTIQGGPNAAGTAGLGALTLNVNSTIDLTGTSVLHFANSTAQSWQPSTILSITNWDGAPTGGGNEQLLFGNGNVPGLTLGQLSQINFIDPTGFAPGVYSAIFAGSDFNEIVPGLAIPEPGTWAGATLALAAIAWTQRKRVSHLFQRA